jgi:hypothetical protein
MFSLVPRIAPRSILEVPTADTPQTDATLVYREATSIRPVDSGSRAAMAAALAYPPPEPSGQHDQMWQSRDAWH